MCPMEFVEQTARVTQGRLTVGTFAPEDSGIGVAIGTREIPVCSDGSGAEGMSQVQFAYFAGLLRSDDSIFPLCFPEVTVRFVV